VRAGQLAGEPGWELPLWDGYRDSLHSEVADLKNFDNDASWGNGAILGTLFLGEFVGDIPWAHVDMAATAFREKTAPGWAAGATGSPVRTLATWLEGLGGAA
jgi:leucyl aminopeptidase